MGPRNSGYNSEVLWDNSTKNEEKPSRRPGKKLLVLLRMSSMKTFGLINTYAVSSLRSIYLYKISFLFATLLETFE